MSLVQIAGGITGVARRIGTTRQMMTRTPRLMIDRTVALLLQRKDLPLATTIITITDTNTRTNPPATSPQALLLPTKRLISLNVLTSTAGGNQIKARTHLPRQ